jgi:hypothetical protein
VGTERMVNKAGEMGKSGIYGKKDRTDHVTISNGRWPANLILSHSPSCKQIGTIQIKTGSGNQRVRNPSGGYETRNDFNHETDVLLHCDKDGNETIEQWECVEDCPIRMLDEQSGILKSGRLDRANIRAENQIYGKAPHNRQGIYEPSKGGASRFFYIAKASKKERELGLGSRQSRNVNDGRKTSIDNPYQRGDTPRKNTHPTVKPLALMRYLIRLTKTPYGGTVLDPFMGSGSTGLGSILEGRPFIGIEKQKESFEIACARISYLAEQERQIEMSSCLD